MSTLNFPKNPKIGDTHKAGTKAWSWNGDAWIFNRDDLIGKSAYQIAIINGYVGTEIQWLESLKAQVPQTVINNILEAARNAADLVVNDGKNAIDIAKNAVELARQHVDSVFTQAQDVINGAKNAGEESLRANAEIQLQRIEEVKQRAEAALDAIFNGKATAIADAVRDSQNAAQASVTAGQSATASATEAGQQATAAIGAATRAATSAGGAVRSAAEAETYRGQASSSASDAQGSAAIAIEKSGLAAKAATDSGNYAQAAKISEDRAAASVTAAGSYAESASTSSNLAATRAQDSANSAEAAAIHASSAESNSTDAAQKATASESSRLQAAIVAAQLFPSTFDDKTFWTNALAGQHPANTVVGNYVRDPSNGYVYQIAETADHTLAPKGYFSSRVGRLYKVETLVRLKTLTTDNSTVHVDLTATGLDSEFNAVPLSSAINLSVASPNKSFDLVTTDWIKLAYTVQFEETEAAAYARPFLRIKGNNKNGIVQVAYLKVQDITESNAAGKSAAAAVDTLATVTAKATDVTQYAAAALANSTSASTSAADALLAKNAANKSASDAKTSATQSSESATTAQGSAAIAQQSAQTAVNSRDEAGNSASAAAISATVAASSATDAGLSAASAYGYLVQAQLGADTIFPHTFDDPTDYVVGGSATAEFVDADGSKVLQFTNGIGTVHHTNARPLIIGRRYQVGLEARALQDTTIASSIVVSRLNSRGQDGPGDFTAGESTGTSYDQQSYVLKAADGWVPFARQYTGMPGDEQYIRSLFEAHAENNAVIQIREVSVRDITEIYFSDRSAAAAALSESNAAVSQTAAGQAATAAREDATRATLQADKAGKSATDAETSKTQASIAAQDAQGSASSASQSESNASRSAALAGNKADASTERASFAATKADEAGQKSSSAAGFADEARTQAQNAKGSADASATSSSTATSKAEAAGISAEAARLAALTATGKAGDAQSSAQLAEASKVAADGFRAAAERASQLSASFGGTGGGNLLSNTDLVTTDGWSYSANNPAGGLFVPDKGIDLGGDDYRPRGEHTIGMHQLVRVGDNSYMDWSSAVFSVKPGDYIQFYAFCLAHRAAVQVIFEFLNASGAGIDAPSEIANLPLNFGVNPADWAQLGVRSYLVPPNAVQGRMILRKHDTQPNVVPNDSYAWFWRPFVSITTKDQSQWMAYSPGNTKAIQTATTARINNVEKVAADANTALATRSTALEATANMGDGMSMNSNTRFGAWPDGKELPTNWIWWAKNGTISRGASENPGVGQYSALLSSTDGLEHGLQSNLIYFGAGWYVLEAEVYLSSGSYQGAGLTLGGIYSLNFAADPDTNGVVSAIGPARRKYAKLVKTQAHDGMLFHAMVNWSGFGNNSAGAKRIYFNRASIRPASDMEIATKTVIDTSLPQLTARVRTTEEAVTDGRFASASRVSELTAQSSNDSNNLVRNGLFNQPDDGWVLGGSGKIPLQWERWDQDSFAYIGPYNGRSNYGAKYPLQIDRNAVNNGVTQSLGSQAAGWYVVEIDISVEDGVWTGAGFHLNANNGTIINYHFATEADTNGEIITGNVPRNRKFSLLFNNATVSPNFQFYLMAGWSAFATFQGFVRTIWHKVVVRAATSGEIKAQKADATLIPGLSARIGVVEKVTTDGTFATASRVNVLEAKTNSGSNLLTNTELVSNTDGWSFASEGGSIGARAGITADQWWPVGTTPFVIGQENTRPERGGYWYQTVWGIEPGATYQFSFFGSGHRCQQTAYVDWIGVDGGGGVGSAQETYPEQGNNGSRSMSTWRRMFVNATAPVGASGMRVYLMKQQTLFGGNSYAWYLKPQVVRIDPSVTTAVPYTPGNNGSEVSNALARIGVVETATTDGRFATASRASAIEARFNGIPETWRVRSAGNNSGKSAGVIAPNGTVYGAYSRSYTVVVFQANTNVVESIRAFDVFGDGFVQYNPGGNSANNSFGMANWLNSIEAGKTVIVYTADEPNGGHTTNGLIEAMYRCGAGEVFVKPFRSHSAYALIGRAGVGKGGGQEFYVGPGDTSPHSWLEIPFAMFEGKATVGTGSGLVDAAARITSLETVTTNGTFATASRANSLEAAISASNGSSMVQNAGFAVWQEGQELPSGWTWWVKNGTYTRQPSSGSSGGFTFRHNVPANIEGGIFQGSTRLQPGWYVMEADIELLDGNLQGAGLTVSGVYSFNFATEADVNGDIGNGGFRRRRFSKLFKADIYADNWHLMTNWTGFGAMSYKYVDWFYAGIRPATDGEIRAQKADAALNNPGGALARIGSLETVTTNGTFASASRANTLEAQMNGEAGSRLLSRAESIAVSQADRAIGTSNSRMDVMVSEYNGIGSKVTQQAGTIADVNYRTRAYIVSTAVAGNNRAQLAIYADSNGGAGVDIVGDVRISGNLVVDGTITSGKMGTSAVQQVAFVTLGYDIAIPRGGYGGGGYGGGGGGGGGGGTQIQ